MLDHDRFSRAVTLVGAVMHRLSEAESAEARRDLWHETAALERARRDLAEIVDRSPLGAVPGLALRYLALVERLLDEVDRAAGPDAMRSDGMGQGCSRGFSTASVRRAPPMR